MGFFSDIASGRNEKKIRGAARADLKASQAAFSNALNTKMTEAVTRIDPSDLADRAAQLGEKAAEQHLETMFKFNQAQMESELASMARNAAKPGLGYRIGRDGVLKTGWGGLKKGGKVALIGGGIIAGVAALGAVASSWRRSAREDSRREIRAAEEAASEIPAVQPIAMMPQQTLMGQPLVTDGPKAQQVLASRGLAPQVQGPINPAMNVSSDVADLGAPRTR